MISLTTGLIIYVSIAILAFVIHGVIVYFHPNLMDSEHGGGETYLIIRILCSIFWPFGILAYICHFSYEWLLKLFNKIAFNGKR